jgi:hypothetical protein
MMKAGSRTYQELPLDVVGSTSFGRYNKISVEETFNMIISDGFLVDFAGYENIATVSNFGTGRGIYRSVRGNFIICVIYTNIFRINSDLIPILIGSIKTGDGDVFIDEDINGNIAICDKTTIWIYPWQSGGALYQATLDGTTPLDFVPNYITYQDGRFISTGTLVDTTVGVWRLSTTNISGIIEFPTGAQYQGQFQTKPDTPVAALRFPGRAGLLFIFGSTVTEIWYDAGLQLFPYQRSNTNNINYGCISSSTIANQDNIVCWLAANEKSGPIIMYSSGGDPEQISNDGINFKLASLTNPADSYGFMFKQDGHLFYVLTFVTDNFSIAYDFNTQKFFTLTDEKMNYFIMKNVAFFNNNYYSISLNNGNFYELSSTITTYDGETIPRVRMTTTKRLPDSSQFITNKIDFVLEQGVDNGGSDTNLPRVDLSISVDGGENFSGYHGMQMNKTGYRRNKFIFWNLGWSNEMTIQLRFFNKGRIVCSNGTMSIYQ